MLARRTFGGVLDCRGKASVSPMPDKYFPSKLLIYKVPQVYYVKLWEFSEKFITG